MTPAILLLSPTALQRGVYSEASCARIKGLVNLIGTVTPADDWRQQPDLMARAEIILTSWGAPVMDEEFLAATPRLRAVFYAAGTVRYCLTEAVWQRPVKILTARATNAIPTAEFAVSMILLNLKRTWHYVRLAREQRTFPRERPMPGIYRSTVGLISYGNVGRLVRNYLRAHHVEVIVYDPYVSPAEAAREKITLVSLDELFVQADVVSVHTPLLPETHCLVTGEHFSRLRSGAAFINTARGAIVDEAALIAAARTRTDLQFVLDVATTEPPPADSPLYVLPNVLLTPHIAGSGGREYQRLGEAMVDELERYVSGRPLQCELTPELAEHTA